MQVLVFLLDEEKYAVNTAMVDTIENMCPISPVPKARKHIEGLINFRGNAIPVINTRMILDLKENCDQLDQKLLIINHKNQKMALAVTDAEEVIEAEEVHEGDVWLDLDSSILYVKNNIITYLGENILNKI